MKYFSLIMGCILAITMGGAWWYLSRPGSDTVVDEEIPAIQSDSIDQSADDPTSTSELAPGESSPEDVPAEVSQSDFVQGDSTYTIDGSLILTRGVDGVAVSLADFSVTQGPDLFVYLVNTQDMSNQGVKDAVARGDFVMIAPLKGNKGNQNYSIPPEIDLDEYTAVSIWCQEFARNFGFAELPL